MFPEEFFINPEFRTFLTNVVGDRDLSPEIRADSLTIYCRGNALIRNLRVVNGNITGEVHYKYIPVRRPAGSDYSRMTLGTCGLTVTPDLQPLSLGFGSLEVLSEFKRVMKAVNGDLECRIIHEIVRHPDNRIIDQEKKFQVAGQPGADKIDLCHYQRGLSCLSFVEVKGIHDRRLLSHSDGVPEVVQQLGRYTQRISEHRQELLENYTSVVGIKRQLGLEDRLAEVPEVFSSFLKKPILVIGGCTNDDVSRCVQNEGFWGPLIEGLRNTAAGLILCGNDGCRLDLPARDRGLSFIHIFLLCGVETRELRHGICAWSFNEIDLSDWHGGAPWWRVSERN